MGHAGGSHQPVGGVSTARAVRAARTASLSERGESAEPRAVPGNSSGVPPERVRLAAPEVSGKAPEGVCSQNHSTPVAVLAAVNQTATVAHRIRPSAL